MLAEQVLMFGGSSKSAFSMEWKTPEASRSKEHSNRHGSFRAPNGPAEHQQLAKAKGLKVTYETVSIDRREGDRNNGRAGVNCGLDRGYGNSRNARGTDRLSRGPQETTPRYRNLLLRLILEWPKPPILQR